MYNIFVVVAPHSLCVAVALSRCFSFHLINLHYIFITVEAHNAKTLTSNVFKYLVPFSINSGIILLLFCLNGAAIGNCQRILFYATFKGLHAILFTFNLLIWPGHATHWKLFISC